MDTRSASSTAITPQTPESFRETHTNVTASGMELRVRILFTNPGGLVNVATLRNYRRTELYLVEQGV
jgi:hypothetical protein